MNDQTQTANAMPDAVPAGYKANAKGHLIPISKIKEIDLLRDEQTRKIVAMAKELHQVMLESKTMMFSDFNDFVALSASEYDTKIGGDKGNATLATYDGSLKVKLQVSENIVFDERLQVAKSLVDECLNEWSEGSNDNIKAIINQSFQVDKEGKISTHRVLGLRSINIKDPRWLKAMEAIRDAIQVTSTKEYLRVYERNEKGAYISIPLDFAAL